MSSHVLLNLFNELRKRQLSIVQKPKHFIAFAMNLIA